MRMMNGKTAAKTACALFLGLALMIPSVCLAGTALQHPACDGEDNWAAAMTGVKLKNAGLSDKAGGYDSISVERIASEPLDNGIFRQVHKVVIVDGANTFTCITVNDTSARECSETPVIVYIVSKNLQ